MNEYLNPCYILAETGTRRHAIMMHYGNGDKPNRQMTVACLVVNTINVVAIRRARLVLGWVPVCGVDR